MMKMNLPLRFHPFGNGKRSFGKRKFLRAVV